MDPQEIINTLIGIVGFLLGYVLYGVRQSVVSLHQSDNDIINRVQQIELLVAGNYVTRTEYQQMAERLYTKLDSIDQKLSTKADK